MNTTTETRLVRLLTLIAICQGLMLVGLLIGGLLGFRAFHAYERQLERVERLSSDATRRQGELAIALEAQSERALGELAALRKRREAFKENSNPLEKINQAFRMGELFLDESLTVSEHLIRTQGDIARNLRPLPAQKKN